MFFALLVSELFEELLEEAIATGITWIIGKVINVLLVITLTQGTKIIIKRFVKTITYKEGEDKMKVLKKLGKYIKNAWLLVWNNKLTATMAAVGVYAGYSFYLASYSNYLWLNIATGIVVGLFAAVFSVKFGGETLTQIIERLNARKLNKADQKKAKEAALKAKEETAKIEAKVAELKAKKEAEDKARLEAEAKLLVEEEIKQELKPVDENK